MYNVNKVDKIIKEELKQSSDRELLEFQCFLQHKQNQFLNYQLNSQKNIESYVNFFYKLVIVQLIITFICLILLFAI
jgi:hypothetical protein